MAQEIYQEDVDIYQFPTEILSSTDFAFNSLTIGDLHGNVIKLIYFLLKHNVIKFKKEITDPEKEYMKFVDIYEEIGIVVKNIEDLQSSIKYKEGEINKNQDFLNELRKKGGRKPEKQVEFFSRFGTYLNDPFEDEKAEVDQLKKELPKMIEYFKMFMVSSNYKTLENFDSFIKQNLKGKKEYESIKKDIKKFVEHFDSTMKKKFQYYVDNDENNIKAKKNKLEEEINKNLLEEPTKYLREFMEKLEVSREGFLLRLMGDELCDRGNSDYATLLAIKKLKELGIKVSILFSNHGNEFVAAYENLLGRNVLETKNDIMESQRTSFLGLKIPLEQEKITEKELIELVNETYKPSLKLLDYTLNTKENRINLFTHAPVPFVAIQQIAEKFDVEYDDSSIEALGATIDDINLKFQRIVENNQIQEHCGVFENGRQDEMSSDQAAEYPLLHVIWNRWNNDNDPNSLTRPPSKDGKNGKYNITYIHGHDSYDNPFVHIKDLNSNCGKLSRTKREEILEKYKAGVIKVFEKIKKVAHNLGYVGSPYLGYDGSSYEQAKKFYDNVVRDTKNYPQDKKDVISEYDWGYLKHEFKQIEDEEAGKEKAPILFSNEKGLEDVQLNKILLERQQKAQERRRSITNIVLGAGLILGSIFGLVLTGVFAPFATGTAAIFGITASMFGGVFLNNGLQRLREVNVNTIEITKQQKVISEEHSSNTEDTLEQITQNSVLAEPSLAAKEQKEKNPSLRERHKKHSISTNYTDQEADLSDQGLGSSDQDPDGSFDLIEQDPALAEQKEENLSSKPSNVKDTTQTTKTDKIELPSVSNQQKVISEKSPSSSTTGMLRRMEEKSVPPEQIEQKPESSSKVFHGGDVANKAKISDADNTANSIKISSTPKAAITTTSSPPKISKKTKKVKKKKEFSMKEYNRMFAPRKEPHITKQNQRYQKVKGIKH